MLFGMTAFLPVAQSGVWQYVQVQALGGAAASVSFTGLTGGQFYMLTGTIAKDSGVTNPVLSVRLNNDATANYGIARISSSATLRQASQQSGQTAMNTVNTLGANGYSSIIAVVSKPAAAIRGQMWAVVGIDLAGLLIAAEKDFFEWGDGANLINRIDIFLASGSFAAASSFRVDRKAAV